MHSHLGRYDGVLLLTKAGRSQASLGHPGRPCPNERAKYPLSVSVLCCHLPSKQHTDTHTDTHTNPDTPCHSFPYPPTQPKPSIICLVLNLHIFTSWKCPQSRAAWDWMSSRDAPVPLHPFHSMHHCCAALGWHCASENPQRMRPNHPSLQACAPGE